MDEVHRARPRSWGITSKNVDSFANSTIPGVRRLLGPDGDMDKALGVGNKWAFNIIKQVGNYGELWDRNITPMGVPRGMNNLCTNCALYYGPPIR